MNRIITWTTPEDAASNSLGKDSTHLIFAQHVQRYVKFNSALSIKFPLQESLPYIVENDKMEVCPGSYYLVNDGVELECLPCKPRVKALFVNFHIDLIKDVCQNHVAAENSLLNHPAFGNSTPGFFQHVYPANDLLGQKLNALAIEMAASQQSRSDLLPDLFYALAELLLLEQKTVSTQIENINARTRTTREELFRRILSAKAFMMDQWHQNLTNEAIATHVCLSPYHFHRSFKEVYGISPMRWFRQLKLEKAKELLRAGKYSVTEVAYACGFADIFTFSKAFKREWGRSPSQAGAPFIDGKDA